MVEPYTGSCTKINIGNPEYNKRRFHLLYGECVFGLTREYRDISTSGKPDVILIGALALILVFTQQNNTAASKGSGGRILKVAGVRNRRYLHLDYASL